MSGVRLNDTQLAILLRAHLPAEARADLRQNIAAEVARTQQHRPLPGVAGIVSDPDPLVRRRLLLVAAAALLLALAAGAALVGSRLLDRDRDLFHDLALDPTANVEGFVQAAYSANFDLPALHLSFGEGSGCVLRRPWDDSSRGPRWFDRDDHADLVGTYRHTQG